MADVEKNESDTTDPVSETLTPLWDALDRLENEWRTDLLGKNVDDASDLLREATDLAVSVIQNPSGDIDDARGALTNRLKGLLDDARLVRLRPSVSFAKSEPETILTSLALPDALDAPLDHAMLLHGGDDALDDRVYKLWRRFAVRVGVAPHRLTNVLNRVRKRPLRDLPVPRRKVRIASISETHLRTGLPMEPALVGGFEVSVLTVQSLKKLWDVFVQEYTALDEREADCDAIEAVCEEALTQLVTCGEAADKEIQACFESVRTTLRTSLDRIDAPWEVYVRAARLYFGKLRIEKRYQRLEKEWESLYSGMLGSFDLGLEIASFEYQATEFAEQVETLVSAHVTQAMLKPLSWMKEACEANAVDARKLFDDVKEDAQGQELKAFGKAAERVQTQLDALITQLSTGYTVHTMQHIDRGRTAAQGRGDLAFMSDATNLLMRQVGGDCDFWVGEQPTWAVGEPPPDVETLRVPVRELIRPLVERNVQPELDTLRQELVDLFVHTQNVLREVWKVIRFNVESGIAEMETGEADHVQLINTAEEIAVGGIERAGARVSDLMEEVETQTQEMVGRIEVLIKNTIEKVEETLQPGSELDVRLRKFTRLARSRAEGYAEFGEGIGAAFYSRWKRVRKVVASTGGQWIGYLRSGLGLAPVAQQEAHETIDEADLGTVSLDRFPPIYRRLYRMEPLQTDDFLVGRAEELDVMRQALNRWENNRASALALVGEVGTGKTTLLNCATPKIFHRYEVFRFAFEETVTTETALTETLCGMLGQKPVPTLDDLLQVIRGREEACVIVLEHGYELFMRRIGGLEVIRAFLQFISASSSQVFWCLSMTESAWRYLDAVVQISEYFPFVIETRNMPANDLLQAVLARHEVSGYGLHFLPSDAPSVARRLKKTNDESEQQQILRDVFFDQLADASKGNVQIALFYWLRAIQSIKENVVYIEPLKPLRFAFLNTLNPDKLFTLAAILQHGTLTVEEHVSIFRSSPMVSQGLLDTLAANNLIQIRLGQDPGKPERYAINPVMRRPVVDLLWNRHIFY